MKFAEEVYAISDELSSSRLELMSLNYWAIKVTVIFIVLEEFADRLPEERMYGMFGLEDH